MECVIQIFVHNVWRDVKEKAIAWEKEMRSTVLHNAFHSTVCNEAVKCKYISIYSDAASAKRQMENFKFIFW